MKDLNPLRRTQLDQLSQRLELTCSDYRLWHQALVHKSSVPPQKRVQEDNERLEFLGDAVMKLAVSHYLYQRFPDYPEGELTKIRAVLVSDETLSRIARRYELGSCLIFSENERRSGGADKISNLANGFEALMGAIYATSGLETAKTFLSKVLQEEATDVDQDFSKRNYKAILQEYTQSLYKSLPRYELESSEGKDHERTFFVKVYVEGKLVGEGSGASKKAAEQQAAEKAYHSLVKEKVFSFE